MPNYKSVTILNPDKKVWLEIYAIDFQAFCTILIMSQSHWAGEAIELDIAGNIFVIDCDVQAEAYFPRIEKAFQS